MGYTKQPVNNASRSINTVVANTFKISFLLYIFLLLSACAPNEDIQISGVWEYEHIDQLDDAHFHKTHFQVGIVENGESVSLIHCFDALNMSLTRTSDILVNTLGQKMRILDENTIESVSVPNLRKLTKQSSKMGSMTNAGTVVLNSEVIPDAVVNSGVCAQRITDEHEDSFELRLSFPYEESVMEIDMLVSDLENTRYNVARMDFYSPIFRSYYSDQRMKLETLQGKIEFLEISPKRIRLTYDIDVVEFSAFPGDRIYGSIDLNI